MNDDPGDRRPLLTAGVVLGIGMGGFFDGILFHEVLQLHAMVSAIRPLTSLVNAEINMFWNGLFHAATWTTTALGIALLFRAGGRPGVAWSGRAFVGALLLGAGLFNLVEGVIDHHILHVHHVVERPGHLPYDLAFLASGVALIIAGWALARPGAARWRR